LPTDQNSKFAHRASLAGPMIELTAREEIRGDFARLKEFLET
jgi:hypothetical protein